ncbi:MAG: DJ-1/PfpI family protein [Chloroflexi bacterium]|nr:DJ-1/PfpI family protein [Chloroflexota bacterium]
MQGNRTALVFWSDYCDEMAATAFVTVLRKQGVRVKLVGADMGRVVGSNGIALLPDITLEQAIPLADQVSAVIVPGGISAVRKLDNDPRVRKLLNRAYAQRALFISSAEAISELATLLAGEHPNPLVVSYPDGWEVIDFARQLGERLVLPATRVTRKSGRQMHQLHDSTARPARL